MGVASPRSVDDRGLLLGIASGLADRRRVFAERHPAVARFILGEGPSVAGAKVHHISVDLPSGKRKVITPDPDYASLPDIAAIVAKGGYVAPPEHIPVFVPADKSGEIYVHRGARRFQRLTIAYAHAVTQIICQVWGIKYEQLMGPSHKYRFAWPRHAAYKMLKERGENVSYPEIGKFFKRDHSTVINGIEKAGRLYASNDEWRANYDHACALLDEAAK